MEQLLKNVIVSTSVILCDEWRVLAHD